MTDKPEIKERDWISPLSQEKFIKQFYVSFRDTEYEEQAKAYSLTEQIPYWVPEDYDGPYRLVGGPSDSFVEVLILEPSEVKEMVDEAITVGDLDDIDHVQKKVEEVREEVERKCRNIIEFDRSFEEMKEEWKGEYEEVLNAVTKEEREKFTHGWWEEDQC